MAAYNSNISGENDLKILSDVLQNASKIFSKFKEILIFPSLLKKIMKTLKNRPPKLVSPINWLCINISQPVTVLFIVKLSVL